MWEYIAQAALAVAQGIAVRWTAGALGDILEQTIMAKNEPMRTADFYTVPEAAELLGLTPMNVIRTYERGFMLPAKRFGRMRMIPADGLDELRKAARLAGYEPKR